MGDIIILSVLAAWLFAAARALLKSRAKGGCSGCSGSCGSCGACSRAMQK